MDKTKNDQGHFNRRDLFAVSALVGGLPALAQAQQPGASAKALTVKDVYAKAREILDPVCRCCPQCDGVACAGEFPGMGGLGSGKSFQNSFESLQRVKLNLRTLTNAATVDRKPDTSTTIFGQKLSLPAIAAPIGAVVANFGKGMSQDRYFDALVGGCADAGTCGAIGDSPSYPVEAMKGRCDIIARYKGRSLYGIKPVPNATILKLIPMVEASGAFMLTIDIDSAGRAGARTAPEITVGPKTVAQLRELVKATKLPVVVKGIMTVDEALMAGEAGVAGIVVSNHGGRVLDHTPGSADALPAIAAKVKGKMVIFVDGCVHYGADVLKYVALGADATMVGRHLVRAAYGGGREGVGLFMKTMRNELEVAMTLTGVSSVAKINRNILA